MPTKKQNLVQFFYRKSQTSNKKIASSASPKLAITAQKGGRENLRKRGSPIRSPDGRVNYVYPVSGGGIYNGHSMDNMVQSLGPPTYAPFITVPSGLDNYPSRRIAQFAPVEK